MSELGLDSLHRSQQTNEKLNSLKKDSITRAAIESIDKAKSASGRSGLASGSAMSSMDMAMDLVKSKINSANASQAFSRKKTQQSIDNLKANVGYLDDNGNWVKGSQGELEQLKSDASIDMANLKLSNKLEIREFDTQMKAADMHEAWQQSILSSVGALFGQDVRGSQAKACQTAGGRWDVNSMTCVDLPEGPTAAENWETLEEAHIDPSDPFQEDMTDCENVEYNPSTGTATCLDSGDVDHEDIPWNPICQEGIWDGDCCRDWSGSCI